MSDQDSAGSVYDPGGGPSLSFSDVYNYGVNAYDTVTSVHQTLQQLVPGGLPLAAPALSPSAVVVSADTDLDGNPLDGDVFYDAPEEAGEIAEAVEDIFFDALEFLPFL